MIDRIGDDASRGSTGTVPEHSSATGCRGVRVVGRPNPLRGDVVTAEATVGMTVAEVLGPVDPAAVEVRLNGWDVPRDAWGSVRPRAGTVLEVVAVPRGGDQGNKQLLAIVGMIAITALSMGASSGVFAVGGLFAKGSLSATLLASAISIGGALALNALIRPPELNLDDVESKKTYGITGVQNRMSPYGAVPLVVGECQMFPTLAAVPYTQYVGVDQYAYMLLDFGPGELEVGNLRVGNTDFGTYGGVEWEIGQNPTMYRYDAYEAAVGTELVGADASHTAVTEPEADEFDVELACPEALTYLHPSNGWQKGSVDVKLEYRLAGDSWIDVLTQFYSVTYDNRTLAAGTTQTQFVLSSASQYGKVGSLVYVTSGHWFRMLMLITAVSQNGLVLTVEPFGHSVVMGSAPAPSIGDSVQVCMSRMVLGSNFDVYYNWYVNQYGTQKIDPDDPLWRLVLRGDKEPFATAIKFMLPPRTGLPGEVRQYEVKVTRTTDHYSFYEPSYDKLLYSVLRTFTYRSPSTLSTTKIAVVVRANEKLNGTIDQINALVKQRIQVWDGAQWVTQASTNPAWIYWWLMVDCPANARRVSAARMDFDTIYLWAQECDTKGYKYGAVVDSQTTLGQVVAAVLAAGRATFTVRDGLYSVVRDVPQVTPVQYFTPRNSSGFSGTRAFADQVHALRCTFKNPNANWQEDERVVYDDGYDELTATKFEEMSMRGVIDAEAVWRLARYHMAVARLRPNEYTFRTDVEHLVCQRGDLVRVAHDVTRWGSGWGRIARVVLSGLDVVALELDEHVAPSSLSQHVVRVRRSDGTGVTSAIKCRNLVSRSTTTVVRATTGTYLGADGLLTFAGPNLPRYEYGADGEYLGLVVEASRMNEVPYHEEWSNWSAVGAIVTEGAGDAPNGGRKANLVEASSTLQPRVEVSLGVPSTSTVYSWSVFVKKHTGRYVSLSTSGTSAWAVFDLEQGSVVASSGCTAVITRFPWGWWRVGLASVTVLPSAMSNKFQLNLCNGTAYGAADGTEKVYGWGGQVEVGLYPSSLVLTSGSPATRAADVVTADFAALGYSASEGTVVVEWDTVGPAGSGRVFQLSDGAWNNNSVLVYDLSPTVSRLQVYSGSAVQAQFDLPSIVGEVQRIAVGFKANDFAVARNGGLVATDSSGSMPIGVNALTIGGGQGLYVNGHVRKLLYYPERKSNAELEEASVPWTDLPDEYLWELAAPLSGVAVGDLAMVGETGLDSAEFVVTKVVPGPDLSATITVVDAAPGVYTADQGQVPSFTSQITGRQEIEPPPPPSISASSSYGSSTVTDDGTTIANVYVIAAISGV